MAACTGGCGLVTDSDPLTEAVKAGAAALVSHHSWVEDCTCADNEWGGRCWYHLSDEEQATERARAVLTAALEADKVALKPVRPASLDSQGEVCPAVNWCFQCEERLTHDTDQQAELLEFVTGQRDRLNATAGDGWAEVERLRAELAEAKAERARVTAAYNARLDDLESLRASRGNAFDRLAEHTEQRDQAVRLLASLDVGPPSLAAIVYQDIDELLAEPWVKGILQPEDGETDGD